ncbi:MAG: enoyl-CoA hydratase/isomerase family protein [Bdellovibrionota bacterium]
MKSLKYFRIEVREKILIAYFDNSAQSNCFGIACAKELQKIIKHVKKDKIEGLLLTSDQRVFCSGGNLSDYAKLKNKAQGIKINKEITKILNEFNKMPVPTICLVTGDCLGGGIEWISAFDTVYATPSALFGMWQRRIGLSWGWGGGHRLKLRVSKKNLMNLLLNANNFSSYQAQELGLIDAIYTNELIFEKGLDFLKKQRDLPKIPFIKIKSGDIKHEQKIFQSLWMNPEHQRLLRRFR